MALFQKIEKHVQNAVGEFYKQIAEKYNISEEELSEMWKEISKSKKKSNGKPRKISGYQNFQKHIREVIKKENPHIAFGEVSKQIGIRWKALSAEEKARYEVSAAKDTTPAGVVATPATEKESAPLIEETMVEEEVSPVKAAEVSSSPKKKKTSKPKKSKKEDTPASEDENEYAKLSLKDLKKICKEKGLNTKGLNKKQELVDLLVEADTKKPKEDAMEESDEDDDASSTYSDLLEGIDDETLLD